MATTSGRRSLFWRVNSATGSAMLAGILVAYGGDALMRGAEGGGDSAARTALGFALYLALFAAVGFVVSMVTYGALLRYYTVSPAAGDNPAEPGATPDRRGT